MLSSSDRTTINNNSTSDINTNASSIPTSQNIWVSCFDARDFRPTSKANY